MAATQGLPSRSRLNVFNGAGIGVVDILSNDIKSAESWLSVTLGSSLYPIRTVSADNGLTCRPMPNQPAALTNFVMGCVSKRLTPRAGIPVAMSVSWDFN